jgi:muramoyltetrapeptide carboxypeptidase
LIEDVSEAPYRIDRMLTQLHLSGVFNGVRGIVFGDSPTCEKPEDDEGQALREVIKERLASLNVPLVYGFPCGHTDYRATLPLGAAVVLDADNGSLIFNEASLESPTTDQVGCVEGQTV